MANLRTKIVVDEKLAEVIREHYRCTAPTEDLSPTCFSSPQMQSHCCNRLEPLEGGEACSYCNHDVKKHCEYSCDISRVCLAVFAYRLGIGGKDLLRAVKKNLAHSYEELVGRINLKLGGVDVGNPKAVQAALQGKSEASNNEAPVEYKLSAVETPEETPEEQVEEVPEEIVEEAPDVPPEAVEVEPVGEVTEEVQEVPDDLMTIPDAATYWGCTKPNIYTRITRGSLKAYIHPVTGKKCVSKADISALMTPKARKTRKKGK